MRINVDKLNLLSNQKHGHPMNGRSLAQLPSPLPILYASAHSVHCFKNNAPRLSQIFLRASSSPLFDFGTIVCPNLVITCSIPSHFSRSLPRLTTTTCFYDCHWVRTHADWKLGLILQEGRSFSSHFGVRAWTVTTLLLNPQERGEHRDQKGHTSYHNSSDGS